MWLKLRAFLTRSPPVVLIQLAFFIFSFGLFSLSIFIRSAKVQDFQSDKAWSHVYGDLSQSYMCAPALEHISTLNTALEPDKRTSHYQQIRLDHGVCVTPLDAAAAAAAGKGTTKPPAAAAVGANPPPAATATGAKSPTAQGTKTSRAAVEAKTIAAKTAKDIAANAAAAASKTGSSSATRHRRGVSVASPLDETPLERSILDTVWKRAVKPHMKVGKSSRSGDTVNTRANPANHAKPKKKASKKHKKKKAKKFKRILHSVMLLWALTSQKACAWKEAIAGNVSIIHVGGTVCGSQLGMTDGNMSRVSFLGELPMSKLDECCRRKSDKKTGDTDCTEEIKTCVSTWLSSDRLPPLTRSPPACKAFDELHLPWLPVYSHKSMKTGAGQCANSTAVFTPKPRKFHQKSFLFDIRVTKSELHSASEKLSTLGACLLLVSMAMMAGFLYSVKPEKRIVAVEKL
eukprot:scpid63124/ scgid13315/ 